MKINVVRLATFFLLLCAVIAHNRVSAQRTVLNMNTDWAFYRGEVNGGQVVELDDSTWMPVVLPHTMRLEKKHCGGDDIYKGIGWYRRYFTLDEKYKDKKVSLLLEAAMTSSTLFVNGKEVKRHYGGYVGYSVDITDYINWDGNNVIAVRVSAEYDPLTPPGKPQDRMDFYYYSGIYRDMVLEITDKLHITNELEVDHIAGGGLFVAYPLVTKERAVVDIKTHIQNDRAGVVKGEVRNLLISSEGRVVHRAASKFELAEGGNAHVSQQIEVKRPKLWHPYTPNQYTLESQLWSDGRMVDSESRKIGIRTIKQTTDGFFINGEYLYLRGANRHQAHANVGDAVSNSVQEREAISFKQGGFNAVRAAHYPQDPSFLDACDKYGLLVIECIPGWQYFNADEVFVERLYDVGRDMIRRDRNHPSIYLWETALNESRYPASLASDLYDIAHSEYPGDQMYTAGDYLGHTDMFDYYDVFYKQVSRYPKDGDVMSNYVEDFVSLKPLYTREWGDGVGEKPRVSLTENEQEQMLQCRGRFDQLNGNGYFDWCMLDANKNMAGHFVWSYNDYARGSQQQTLYCGVVDINRYPKFSYYMSQSMRDKGISQDGLYDGPMVYIASCNSSDTLISSTTDITVFSNCDEVKLYRNNKLVGAQTRIQRTPLYAPIVDKGGSPSFVFDATHYEAGELKAEALIDGKVVAVHTVRTPERATNIEIDIDDKGIKPVADGSDMVGVYFKICDDHGTLVNSSDAMIDIRVEGAGELIGAGVKRIGVSRQKVEGGVGFAFVRTHKKAGDITVIAESEGLEMGRASISSVSYKAKHLQDGTHTVFTGGEEDNVKVSSEKSLTEIVADKPIVAIASVEADFYQANYPVSNITDGNHKTWWISNSDKLPQSVTLKLEKESFVFASAIWLQKDSASYKHTVETSIDGKSWDVLYSRECTGWEFKPVLVNRNLLYYRITFHDVSEGRAGLGEVVLYGI